MIDSRTQVPRGFPRYAYVLLATLLVILWFAGGASRADALGQTIVRATAWAMVIGMILFAPRPPARLLSSVPLLLAAAILLVVIQLIPLPPSVWTALPGRDLLAGAADVAGIEQPWRPISISPEATINALGSLIVPVAVLGLLLLLPRDHQQRTVGLFLILVLAGCVMGLFQFSGAHFDHPLINDMAGEVSGNFANRNHLALFVAAGCVLGPVYAFGIQPRKGAAFPLAAGLLLLFVVVMLAIGSRAGVVLGAVGILVGLLIVRKPLSDQVRRLPRKWTVAALATFGVIVAATVALGIWMGRAATLDRFFSDGAAAGLRGMIRPTLFDMIEQYFPFGTGYGTFDAAYRIDEPLGLLSTRYVNLAHNDVLQVALDGGLPGVLLLVAALAWWASKSIEAWRNRQAHLQRAGSGILLLVILASIMDYPARTPMIMALTVVAAVWLSLPIRAASKGASPSDRLYRM